MKIFVFFIFIRKMFDYPLKTYADVFGGIYSTLMDLGQVDFPDSLCDQPETSMLVQATKSLDALLRRRLRNSHLMNTDYVNWINSKVLDLIIANKDEPFIALCKEGYTVTVQFMIESIPDYYLYKELMQGLEIACKNNRLETISMLITQIPNIIQDDMYNIISLG